MKVMKKLNRWIHLHTCYPNTLALAILLPVSMVFCNVALAGWRDDCCIEVREPCNARPNNPAPLCQEGTRVVDLDCNSWCCFLHGGCGDIGCAGDCPCEPLAEDSICGDDDNDGLINFWEQYGVTDIFGDLLVDLPGYGADYRHKDIFLELDWVEGHEPRQYEIRQMKQAFALAPKAAGGTNNPDGRIGIDLWVDTGSLTDPNGREVTETPGATGSCTDGIDNNGNGLVDLDDPNCQGPFGTCRDGIDNDGNGLIDAADPNCLAGDNLGGGNMVSRLCASGPNKLKACATDADCGGEPCEEPLVTGLDEVFYAVKRENFDENRYGSFRYALSSPNYSYVIATVARAYVRTPHPPEYPDWTTIIECDAVIEPDGSITDPPRWTPYKFAGKSLAIISGTGVGQTRPIFRNSTSTIEVLGLDAVFKPAPDNTSTIRITGVGGMGEVGCDDFVDFNHDGGSIMHELGHNLGLEHGGSEGHNYKPNYVSIMNYDHQVGIRGDLNELNKAGNGRILDFSPPRFERFDFQLFPPPRSQAPLPSLNEESLNELTILSSYDNANRFVFRNQLGSRVQWPLNNDLNGDDIPEGVDWEGDLDYNASGLTIDVDGDGKIDNNLQGYDDWAHIRLPIDVNYCGGVGQSAVNPSPGGDPTTEELMQMEEELNTTDLGIIATSSPDAVVVGGTINYAATISNRGPNPAKEVVLEVKVPPGISFLSATSNSISNLTCKEDPAGTLVCNLGELPQLTSADVKIVVQTVPNEVQTVTTDISVKNLAGPDADISNQTVTLVKKTTDIIPPSILSITAVPNILWPPSHKMVPVNVGVVASDNCDPNPLCKIASISSNEPEKGLGKGDMAPDWQITGNRRANLRAERSGEGNGRVYTINIMCTDTSGNKSKGTINVTVPHDQGK